MKKLVLCMFAVAAMLGAVGRAQDYAGDWQGTLKISGGELKMVVKVSKGEKGVWTAKLFNATRATPPMDASSVTVDGSAFKFAADLMGAKYEGRLSADGKTIVGTWSMGGLDTPVTLARATPETAWDIPAPPPPPKTLPPDADPSFDVATIKPNPSGAASLQQLTTNGHNFVIRNGSLGDMIAFAYNVQMKQIAGAPSWLDEDRYDVAATQDQDGLASDRQLRGMVRKMLEDRFKLTVHHDKRELAAFVLTVGKNGQKLTPTQTKGPLPGMGFGKADGGVLLRVNNGTLDDLTDFLQSAVLDKPVINHTEIPGRFDIGIKFMPDDSQFKGHPPKVAESDTTEVAPNLFDAMEQQLGLKLSAEKTQVDVIAIDHVEKPTAN